MEKKIKPHAPYTTLRACIEKSGKKLLEPQILKLGLDAADAHYLIYQSRPRKVELFENGKIVIINFYPKKFQKIILNLIKNI